MPIAPKTTRCQRFEQGVLSTALTGAYLGCGETPITNCYIQLRNSSSSYVLEEAVITLTLVGQNQTA